MGLAAALFIVVALVACGSDDDEQNELEVESDAPKITIEPGRLEFTPEIGPGDEEELFVTISNVGAEELRIWNVRISDLTTDVHFIAGENFPHAEVTLQTLETYRFSVIYRPGEMGRHVSAVNMESNDPEWPDPIIALRSEDPDE